MTTIDLGAFGFTPTESLAYTSLLRLGPSTGYAVALATRLARVNAYAALEGLVARGAAIKAPGRPARYRPTDPQSLLIQLAAAQGDALERLGRALDRATPSHEPAFQTAEGVRAIVNVLQLVVARATSRIQGVIGAEVWRPTLPAWRRAAARATLDVRLDQGAEGAGELVPATAPPGSPTVLVIDDMQVFTAAGSGDAASALWTTHPLVVALGRAAVQSLP
jgi:sugar-specific transcriptional regulator TrmB